MFRPCESLFQGAHQVCVERRCIGVIFVDVFELEELNDILI